MRLLLAASLLAICAASVHAETFTVTRTDDPLPDACAPGDCSLREAILAAGANDPFGETDTIVLPNGAYTLIRGPLDVVRQSLRVQGGGSGQTLITSDASLFAVDSGPQRDGDLHVSGLSLKITSDYKSALGANGGILSVNDVIVEAGFVFAGPQASLALRNFELHDSLDSYGELLIEDSAIFNLYQYTDTARTTLRRVLVDDAMNPGAPLPSSINLHGGALVVEDSTWTDTVLRYPGIADVHMSGSTIVRSEINESSAGSTLTIEDSTITRSNVRVFDPATLTLRRVHYVDNTAPIRTKAAASVTIEDSLFENNTARALYAASGAEWNVTGSSFVKNRVDGNAGGAILLEDDTVLRIRNSTFSGNTFSNAAAANGARGAAIGYRNGAGAHLIVVHSTIVAPSVMPAGTVGGAIGGHDAGIAVDVANSIVRGSCGMDAHLLQNNSGDIESPGNTCGLDAEQNYVSVGSASLALGPLADNGGPTPTILPGAGSLAINRGGTPQCLPTDQRGYARPGGARCDIGAVEADADDTLFADGFDG